MHFILKTLQVGAKRRIFIEKSSWAYLEFIVIIMIVNEKVKKILKVCLLIFLCCKLLYIKEFWNGFLFVTP